MSRKPRNPAPQPEAKTNQIMENLTPTHETEQSSPQTEATEAAIETRISQEEIDNKNKLFEMQAEIDRLKEEAADREAFILSQQENIKETSKPRKALPNISSDGKTFGNKDEAQKYPFPIGWMGMVVVSQFNAATLPSGAIVPDEPTRRTMPYEPFVFDKLQKDGGFGDLQYIILHDPR